MAGTVESLFSEMHEDLQAMLHSRSLVLGTVISELLLNLLRSLGPWSRETLSGGRSFVSMQLSLVMQARVRGGMTVTLAPTSSTRSAGLEGRPG